MPHDMALFSQQIGRAALSRDLLAMNEKTKKYGLVLSAQEVTDLVEHRAEALSVARRVEFGKGVLPDLIAAFASSPFLIQETYAQTIADLQSAFFQLKEDSDETIADDVLIDAMRWLFDHEANGSVDCFDGLTLSEVVSAAGKTRNDEDEDWSEYDLREGGGRSGRDGVRAGSFRDDDVRGSDAREGDARDETVPDPIDEITRIYEGNEHDRPDNEYADNFYNAYNELYQSGFDWNSRIGGSSL